MADLSSARQAPLLDLPDAIRLLPPAARFTLRGLAPVMTAAGAALGLSMSALACRSDTHGQRAALWMGPDEQLILVPVTDGGAVVAQLREALGALPHSLVDVSHRQLALEVSGPTAQTLLNAGCPLDLHPSAFPIGMCTRTVLGKADIVLWRTGPDSFHVEVWRSFADYVARFLAEAARELA
ncbi:MAG: sarcosine oxidase subunit gamma family protein [Proteobacteria bacterium]|nr:sarcosine oxidase subunit gamma family protein [Pseudomonadota bacterium]